MINLDNSAMSIRIPSNPATTNARSMPRTTMALTIIMVTIMSIRSSMECPMFPPPIPVGNVSSPCSEQIDRFFPLEMHTDSPMSGAGKEISGLASLACIVFVVFIEGHHGSSTTSQMYLLISTGIWMNKTSIQQPSSNTRNVPFGVFGVMLPYKAVRASHFSHLCVSLPRALSSFSASPSLPDENGHGRVLYYR